MYIEEIKLKNFRNYNNQEIKLKNGINLFYGNNAQGKTNIIESVFLCSMGKSFRARRDKELINFNNNDQATIELKYSFASSIDENGLVDNASSAKSST